MSQQEEKYTKTPPLKNSFTFSRIYSFRSYSSPSTVKKLARKHFLSRNVIEKGISFADELCH